MKKKLLKTYFCFMLRALTILKNSFLMAMQQLRTNKVRTFLSLLGVAIGIFCVVSIFTLTKSLEINIRQDMSSMGSNVIYVQKWPWKDTRGDWWEYAHRPSGNFAEFQKLEKRLPHTQAMAYIYSGGNKTVEYGDAYMEGVKMNAVTVDFNKIQSLRFAAGRFFNAAETQSTSMTVILGTNIWSGLFPSARQALFKKVRIKGMKFTVIGALQEYGDNLLGGFDYDNSILLPYTSALRVESDKNHNPSILIKPAVNISNGAMKEEIRGAMRAIRQLTPKQKDNFAMNEMSMLEKPAEQIFSKLNVGGLFIGIFALIVGAFGIANIMFVTVKERTSIIGLKKAVGAKRLVILQEFLIEAIILCVIGGILGMILVYIVTQAISSSVFFQVYMTPRIVILGILVSVVTGIVAGFIPAQSASKLDPVVAIRS